MNAANIDIPDAVQKSERQPTDVQSMLLRTSIIDRMNGELADLLSALALGAEPAHLARRGGNGFDRRIIFRQPDEFLGREVGARHGLGKLVPPRLDRDDAL